jgi:hypothetical protein
MYRLADQNQSLFFAASNITAAERHKTLEDLQVVIEPCRRVSGIAGEP